MAFNGSGTFNRLYSWVIDRNLGIKILASKMDAEMDGFATGLTTCITKDGQTTISAAIPFNAQKITGLGNATADADALNRITADNRLTNHGECYLEYSSTTVIKLMPYNGNSIIIDATRRTIPAAGVTYTPTGLATTTMHYLYAYYTAGAIALEASVTAYAVSATNGLAIKSGDSTRTLVGMIHANTATTIFAQSSNVISVLSWFNRRKRVTGVTTSGAGAHTSYTQLTGQCSLLAWSGEGLEVTSMGAMTVGVSATNVWSQATLAGVAAGPEAFGWIDTPTAGLPVSVGFQTTATEGVQSVGVQGKITTGTGTWTLGTYASTMG